MGQALILETTFLVDLEREASRGEVGPAHRFLEGNRDRELCIVLTTAGELACGPRMDQRSSWETLVDRFRVLTPGLESSWAYGQRYRYLKDNGLLIGANDLWIAAVAIVHGLPLVTRDANHFKRVPGLRVMTYADSSET
jgi:tRNA(fMet)-specific endonuclease VapC